MTAYELADFIDRYCVDNTSKEAAKMLRQQADRIAELEKDGKVCATCGGLVYDAVLPQTKPLSDEEIIDIALSLKIAEDNIESNWGNAVIELVKTIEKRHGIK